MRVRCRATADYRSNAVGNLELEVKPVGLAIALRGVSSYREGYAPGPPVNASAIVVPWPDVYATRIGDERLLLSVNGRCLPQNRLLLEHFADPPPGDAPGFSPLQRALMLCATGAALLALGVPLGLAGALPQPQTLGTLGMAALLAALVMTVVLVRSRRAPQRSSAEVLSDLSLELARYLPNHIAVEAATPAPSRFETIELSSYLPRSAVGIAITLAATTLAALIGSSAARPTGAGGGATPVGPSALDAPSVQTPESRNATVENAEPSGIDPRGPGEPALEGTTERVGEPCRCERDEALLWRDPLPRLAPVVIGREIQVHDGHQHTELELALVNDGADAAERISLSVLFFEERTGPRAGAWQTGERPVYFEGPLGPGRTLNWHVEGRGTSFDIVGPDFGMLARDGSDAAPAEAFVALAREGARPLRLHAARMLAFLGDRRAADAALALRSTASAGEAAYLDRIAAAPRDVVTCRIRVTRERSNWWRLDACLYNRSAEPRADLALRLIALDDTLDGREPGGARSPEIVAEHTARLDLALAPKSGRALALRAPLALESGVVARAFEVMVDREENLP
jgi:hypothetical protein